MHHVSLRLHTFHNPNQNVTTPIKLKEKIYYKKEKKMLLLTGSLAMVGIDDDHSNEKEL